MKFRYAYTSRGCAVVRTMLGKDGKPMWSATDTVAIALNPKLAKMIAEALAKEPQP